MMRGMIAFPEIDPVIFRLGPLAPRWYGLMYLVGFAGGYLTIRRQLRDTAPSISREQVEGLVLWAAVGLIVGARLGEVFFYQWPNWRHYLADPLEIIAVWHGGMSFHGGLIGAVLAGTLFLRRQGMPFWPVSDACFLAVPIGLGAGRLGNFINGELFGRITEMPWGMVFPGGGPLPRHPSQIYELLLEGPLLFWFLWRARLSGRPGALTARFLLGYAAARFAVEFFREPDPQLGFLVGFLTMGQLLSLAMAAAGIMILMRLRGSAS